MQGNHARAAMQKSKVQQSSLMVAYQLMGRS